MISIDRNTQFDDGEALWQVTDLMAVHTVTFLRPTPLSQGGPCRTDKLKRSRARFLFVQPVYADGDYAGRLVGWAKDKTYIVLEIIRRNAMVKGFEVLRFCRGAGLSNGPSPGSWKNCRFARDYEQLTSVAETLIVIAACATLVRRWP